jgi:phage FluMu protein Com
MKFKCPRCEDSRFEEVLAGVTQYTEVQNIYEEDGEVNLDYGDHMLEDGEVSHFQCFKCGHILADNEKEMLAYLKENDMLS